MSGQLEGSWPLSLSSCLPALGLDFSCLCTVNKVGEAPLGQYESVHRRLSWPSGTPSMLQPSN